MTTQAMKALQERQETKKAPVPNQRNPIFLALGIVAGLAVIILGWRSLSPATNPQRNSDQSGKAQAELHIQQKYFALHVIEGHDTGVTDHGQVWSQVLREGSMRVYITRHTTRDIGEREGFIEYCRGYNATMLEYLKAQLGPDFLSKAKIEAMRRG